MESTSAEWVFRFPCADAQRFLARHGARIVRRGLFLDTAAPLPAGASLRVRIDLQPAGAAIRGEVVVVASRGDGARPGMLVRFVALDPASLPLPLPVAYAASAPGAPEGGASAVGASASPPEVGFSSEVSTRPDGFVREARRAQAEEQKTRVHRYTSAELARLGPDSEAWVGGLRPFDSFGPYQLLSRLGSGGMAEVYLARALLGESVEKLVALKMVLPEYGPGTEFASLFLDEARIGVTFGHPNLVQVFDVGEAAGRPFLAMEYVQGWSVTQLLAGLRASGRRPPVGFAVAVALELCRALEHVHGKRDLEGRPLRLVHRDVSASNVLVSEGGEVKLVDFGIVAAERADAELELVAGKRGYMPPEQGRGGRPQASWDIFALGVLLREMLTLQPPPGAETTGARARASEGPPPPPPSQANPGVPPPLDALVVACTSLRPEGRPGSAALVRARLEEIRELVPECDAGALGRELLGPEIEQRKAEIARLLPQARRRSSGRFNTGETALNLPYRWMRRRIVSSAPWLWGARHRGLVRVGVAALLVAGVAGGWAGVSGLRRERAVGEHLRAADAQAAAARLVGPGGDAALDHLLAARALRPDDPQIEARLRLLAEALVRLGDLAERRDDLAEAAVHYQAALRADPRRPGLAPHLERLEEAVRQGSSSRAVRTP